MQIRDLLADHTLHLELRTPTTESRMRWKIRRCAPTEQLDPTPFLDPHVLVLTAGIGMNFSDPSVWDAYVERLTKVSVSALAFAAGIAHPHVPDELVAACHTHNMPLLEVPTTVPLLKINQHVDALLQAEHFKLVNAGWALADECAHLANRGAELSTLLASTYTALKSPLAVYDAFGALIAQYPESVSWKTGRGAEHQTDMLSITLPMGLANPCRLAVKLLGNDATELDAMLTPVASILALQLNRSANPDSGSQQEMRHFAELCVAWSEATRQDVAKGFQTLGLSRRADTSLLVADMSGDHATATWQLRLALHNSFQDVRIAEFDGRLIALAQFPRDTIASAEHSILHVDPPVPLILRTETSSIDELRIALVHALDLVRHVERPYLAPVLGLSAVVAASAGRGARESAHRFLNPLVQNDAQKSNQLMPTLKAWLHNDASPSRTCEELFIHRNSLGYRLRKIESLLDVDLDSVEGQATCLMALKLVDLEPY